MKHPLLLAAFFGLAIAPIVVACASPAPATTSPNKKSTGDDDDDDTKTSTSSSNQTSAKASASASASAPPAASTGAPTAVPTGTGTVPPGGDPMQCWISCISAKGGPAAALDQCAAKCPEDASGDPCLQQCWQTSGCAQQEQVCDAAQDACDQQCPLPPGMQQGG